MSAQLLAEGTQYWLQVSLDGVKTKRHKRWSAPEHLPARGELRLVFASTAAAAATIPPLKAGFKAQQEKEKEKAAPRPPTKEEKARRKHSFQLHRAAEREALLELCRRAAAEPGRNLVGVTYAASAEEAPQPFLQALEEPGWAPPEAGVLALEEVFFERPFVTPVRLVRRRKGVEPQTSRSAPSPLSSRVCVGPAARQRLKRAEDRAQLLRLAEEAELVWRRPRLGATSWVFSLSALRHLFEASEQRNYWGELQASGLAVGTRARMPLAPAPAQPRARLHMMTCNVQKAEVQAGRWPADAITSERRMTRRRKARGTVLRTAAPRAPAHVHPLATGHRRATTTPLHLPTPLPR